MSCKREGKKEWHLPKSYISTKKKESSSSFFILSCHRKYRTNDIFSPLINYLKFSFDNEIDKNSIFRKIRVNYYMAKNVVNGSLEHRPKLINFLSGDQSPPLMWLFQVKRYQGILSGTKPSIPALHFTFTNQKNNELRTIIYMLKPPYDWIISISSHSFCVETCG